MIVIFVVFVTLEILILVQFLVIENHLDSLEKKIDKLKEKEDGKDN